MAANQAHSGQKARDKYPDAAEVKRKAAGRWDGILQTLAPSLADAIAKNGKHVECPVHGRKQKGGHGDGLRIFTKPGKSTMETGGVVCNTCGIKIDGFATLMWINGTSFAETVKDVNDHLEGNFAGYSPEELARQNDLIEKRRQEQLKQQVKDDAAFKAALNRVWGASLPMTHPLAEPGRLYLAKRGIVLESFPGVLRFHPALNYVDEDDVYHGKWPGIIAKLSTVDNKPGNILRLFVTPEGDKPDLPERKKMMCAPSTTVLTGGAIRLTPVSTVLGVAEGVETALAAQLLFGINTWSCFSATLLEGFVPPEGVEKVIIFADKDVSLRGQEAANILKERLWGMGIMAAIQLPKAEIPPGQKGVDWNDVLEAKASKYAEARLAKACKKAAEALDRKEAVAVG